MFAAVAERNGFAGVADPLKLSPVVSRKHTQHIEARLGARLLNRNSRNMSLTEAGVQYLATVRPLPEGLELAEAELAETTLKSLMLCSILT